MGVVPINEVSLNATVPPAYVVMLEGVTPVELDGAWAWLTTRAMGALVAAPVEFRTTN